MHTSQVHAVAEQLGIQLKERHLRIATAESCTGGQLAQTITAIPGSSQWFERGFIPYSPLSKQELLGVQSATLARYGPVSKETAAEMAKGVLQNSAADLSIAITGIAGPDGGTEEHPVGTIYFAWAHREIFCDTHVQHFTGDRLIIRYAAVEFALKKLSILIQKNFKTC
ncbi:MAG: CinA family protein [Pseudomonadota bacterium]